MKHQVTVALFLLFLLAPVYALAAPTTAQTDAQTGPVAGEYCPEARVKAVILEELSLSAAMAAKADKALSEDKLPDAALDLANANAALQLASSRGSAARTTKLIDAAVDSKASENYKLMLGWFPLLQTAIGQLPDNAYTNAAAEAVSRSEAVLQGDRDGDALSELRTARHWLTCDKLEIPVQEAKQGLGRINQALYQREKPKPAIFEEVYKPLRQAIEYLYAQGNTRQ
ncbi:MAG: hypothetical protein PVH25_13670 [Burkholderiales bacterium]